MISDEFGLIFIHIPKSAGCSLETLFNKKTMNHETSLQIYEKIGKEKWNQYFKFAIIRNTWDRLVSIFKFRKNNLRIIPPEQSFKNWIVHFFETKNSISQLDYIFINNKNSMDELIKFEEVYKVDDLFKKLNINKKMIHVNKTKYKNYPYQYYYDKKTVDIVYKKYAKEINYFKFDFSFKKIF